MADLLVQFDEPSCGVDGRCYIAQVRGQLAADDLWEAWIEFSPIDGGEPICTGRETEQFTCGDLRYWAARLTREYLGAALGRALAQTACVGCFPSEFASSGGGGDLHDAYMRFESDGVIRALPVVDPFLVYRELGLYALRQELRLLDARRLQDIIASYEIPELDTSDMLRTFEDALAERIVADVQHRVESEQLAEVGTGALTR